MVTLVDTKYYSAILRRARREQHLNMTDAAKMFRISRKEYRRYEHGKEPIPENILMCLFRHGFCMLKCK